MNTSIKTSYGKGVLFDDDGFLRNPEDWNEDLAIRIARHDGIGDLNEDHWHIIRYLRAHFMANHTIPVMRHVCRVNHLDDHCVPRLFGKSTREAWRIAGLPDPGEEAKSYM